MDNKYDVFISYSSHNTNVVNEFVERLEHEGYCVWIDRAGIESGDAFKRIILQAIKKSNVVLFFSSQYSNQSSWTAKEIGVAVKYQKTVIPILLDGSNFNEEVEFDLINLDFIDYQDVTLRAAMMDRLVKSLKAKIPNPIGLKKPEEARLKAEAAERERLELERKKKEEAERKAREAAELEPRAMPPHSYKPTPKNKIWIAIAAAVALALLLLLLLKPKKGEPIVPDPDMEAYQACQTVQDYRHYIAYYGQHAQHYAEAKDFIDCYVADSLQQVQDSLAKADAERKEYELYRKCNTTADCDAYLMAYPQGKYLNKVKSKKAELEKEDLAYDKCTTIEDCDAYLKAYLQGRYVTQVKTKKTELEAKTVQACLTGTANGHDYVDLGLPSGTLWATCNMGASKPEDYGNYYAWGEIRPKAIYNWETYKYANGDGNKLTKYCAKKDYGNDGFTDNLSILQNGDDAATTNWGSGWCTPSKAQWEELKNNTTHKWTMRNGKQGRLFTAKNGQSVFLPAAGTCWDSEFYNAGSYGRYWSRSLYIGYPHSAWCLYFDLEDWYMGYGNRYYGFSVRPVREK